MSKRKEFRIGLPRLQFDLPSIRHAMETAAAGVRYPLVTNNFDSIRLFLAIVVLITHLNMLLHIDNDALNYALGFFSGGYAVFCFYVISGFLIFRSYRRSATLWTYAKKRAARLYPAYLVTIVGCFIVGLIMTEDGVEEYLSSGAIRYLFYNLLFMTFKQPILPGVFQHNEFTNVNGALWTLKIEVIFYISVPIIIEISRRYVRFDVLAVLLYAGSALFSAGTTYLFRIYHWDAFATLWMQFPGQLAYFMVGGLIEYRFETFRRCLWPLLAAAALVVVASPASPANPLFPAAIGILVMYVCCLGPRIVNLARYGDFSYGLYIVHYPIIQIVVASRLLPDRPALQVIIATSISFLTAVVMWHGVEKHWLRGSSRERSPATAPSEALIQ